MHEEEVTVGWNPHGGQRCLCKVYDWQPRQSLKHVGNPYGILPLERLKGPRSEAAVSWMLPVGSTPPNTTWRRSEYPFW